MLDTIKQGDWQQIAELSRIYNELFVEKESFVENVLSANLTAYQLGQAEAKLCMITGKLKEADAKIHSLMFGSSEGIEQEAMPLMWQAEKRLPKQYVVLRAAPVFSLIETPDPTIQEKRWNFLEKRHNHLKQKIDSLNSIIYQLRKQLRQVDGANMYFSRSEKLTNQTT